MSSIPRVWEASKPYKDVLEGSATPETFVVNLGGIWERLELGKNVHIAERYLDPIEFVRRTLFTDRMKELIRNVFKRLSSIGGDSIYMVTVPMGGGKSHTLLILYYTIKYWDKLKNFVLRELGKDLYEPPKDSRVIVIDGQRIYVEFPDGTRIKTIWGLLYKQLGSYSEEIDSWRYEIQVPELRELLSEKPTLILVDELTSYVAQIATDRIKYEKVLAFIQALTTAVSESPNVVIIMTIPSGVYSKAQSDILGKVKGIASRFSLLQELIDAKSKDEVRKKAIFEEYSRDTGLIVAREYLRALGKDGNIALEEQFVEAYPYHPSLLKTLGKLREGGALKEVREELRFIASIVYSVFKHRRSDSFTIDIGSANLHDSIVIEAIVDAGALWREALLEDLDRLEKAYRNRSEWNILQKIFTAIVINSIAGPSEEHLGLSEDEIVFAVSNPLHSKEVIKGLLPKILQANLHMLEYNEEHKRYVYGKPSFIAILHDYKRRTMISRLNEWWEGFEKLIKDKKIIEKLRQWAGGNNIFKHKNLAEIIPWPSRPTEIPDGAPDEKGFLKDKIKLILLRYTIPLNVLNEDITKELREKRIPIPDIEDFTANSCREAIEKVVRFMESDKTRKCLNTLIFLVADRNEVKKRADYMIEYMTIEDMLSNREEIEQKYGASIIDKIESRKAILESQLANPFIPYRFLIYPSKPKSEDGPPYACEQLREEDTFSIKSFLDSVYNVLYTRNRIIEKFDPKTFLDLYWPVRGSSRAKVSDFIEYFYKIPGLEIPINYAIILNAIIEAVKHGKAILLREGKPLPPTITIGQLRPTDIVSRDIERVIVSISAEDLSGKPISNLIVDVGGSILATPVEKEVIKGTKLTIRIPGDYLEYEFVRWSDGRKDRAIELEILTDTHLKFIVKRKGVKEEYATITFTINEGKANIIVNESEYTVEPLNPVVISKVKGTKLSISVIPVDGYEFLGWSDGSLLSSREIILEENITLQVQLRRKTPERKTETYKGELRKLQEYFDRLLRREKKILSITLSIESSLEPTKLINIIQNLIRDRKGIIISFEVIKRKYVKGIEDMNFKIIFRLDAIDRVLASIRSMSKFISRSKLTISRDYEEPIHIDLAIDRNVIQALSSLEGEFELKVDTLEI